MTLQKTTELTKFVENMGMTPDTTSMLTNSFNDFLIQANEWKEEIMSINVTSELQVAEMKKAGEFRKALKKIRVEADKKRKELKADALAYGKAVQNVYALIESTIKPLEDHAYSQENYIKIQEELRLTKLRGIRIEAIKGYENYLECTINGIELLEEDEFQYHLDIAKAKYQMEVEREQKERQEKALKEEEERIERLRLEEENRLLKQQLSGNIEEDIKPVEEDPFEAELMNISSNEEQSNKRLIVDLDKIINQLKKWQSELSEFDSSLETDDGHLTVISIQSTLAASLKFVNAKRLKL